MRLFELLEGIQNKFQADLNSLLMTIKAANTEIIPTATLVRELNDMGHSITINNLVNIAKDYPIIKSADQSQVIISVDGQEQDASMDSQVQDRELSDAEADKMTVNDMAKKGIQQ